MLIMTIIIINLLTVMELLMMSAVSLAFEKENNDLFNTLCYLLTKML